ncbi:MAG: nitroreductase/quinone reductase family protein [Actinomycetota bacterium]|nr:nitroreductase/quinone reductase family protein [Actinomycetota bacterium]
MASDETHAVLHTVSAEDGTPRRHRIWFVLDRSALDRTSVYVFSGGRREPAWLTNLRARPGGEVTIGGETWRYAARIDVLDEAERDRALGLLRAKYRGRTRSTMTSLRGRGVLVALDLTP